ncbi:2-C-methyl-D-erythritol 2,4-cyclodiphosphate synthase [Chitinivibrio alkaliphilus]|uniref:2-C-methyl-D-erythritol 2,4-cyclodiphosphate synthase n=1 Tax=Chitinivibrio alkaliphilus TaxID=1505232 RepID=UPI0005593795
MKVSIGQDSHRFCQDPNSSRPLILGGVPLPGERGLAGNSDADVVLHALTNAISGITGTPVLGKQADILCLEQNITDSAVYLEYALKQMSSYEISHLSFSIEAKTPKLLPHFPAMKENIARLCGMSPSDIGITATTGEGLSGCGKGRGIQVFVVLTAVQK